MSIDADPQIEDSLDEVRIELRQHLEWSAGVGTLAVLLARSPQVLREIRSSTLDLLRRRGRQITVLEAQFASDSEIRHSFSSDVVWIDLPFGNTDVRQGVLRVLNHVRTSLGRSGAAVVLTGPVETATEAATEAADLWSVAGFVRWIAAPVVEELPAKPSLSELAERRPHSRIAELQFAGIYVRPEDRDRSTLAVLAALRRAHRYSSDDLAAARREAMSAVALADLNGPMVALSELACAELAVRAGDKAAAAVAGRAALRFVQGHVGTDVLGALVDLAWVGGDLEVARAAGDRILDDMRPAEDLPSRRRLAQILEDRGFLVLVNSDGPVALYAAHDYLERAFYVGRAVAEETNELSDWGALADAMEIAGWGAAMYLGNSGTAAYYYEQALPIRRDLYARDSVAVRRRELAKNLELLADVEAGSDPESAVAGYREAIALLAGPRDSALTEPDTDLDRLHASLSRLQLRLAG